MFWSKNKTHRFHFLLLWLMKNITRISHASNWESIATNMCWKLAVTFFLFFFYIRCGPFSFLFFLHIRCGPFFFSFFHIRCGPTCHCWRKRPAWGRQGTKQRKSPGNLFFVFVFVCDSDGEDDDREDFQMVFISVTQATFFCAFIQFPYLSNLLNWRTVSTIIQIRPKLNWFFIQSRDYAILASNRIQNCNNLLVMHKGGGW